MFPQAACFHLDVSKICLKPPMLLSTKNKLKSVWCFMAMLLLSTTRRRQRDWHAVFTTPRMTHQQIWALLMPFFPLLLLFVLILKARRWQINNLSAGFQMSQQNPSSHADVSVGSDGGNSIAAQRERSAGLWPLARSCILSSLVRRDAKLQSLNAARPPAHLSTVSAVLGVHPGDTAQNVSLGLVWVVVMQLLWCYLFNMFKIKT